MFFSNYKNYRFRLYRVIKLPRVLFYCLKRIKIASKKKVYKNGRYVFACDLV